MSLNDYITLGRSGLKARRFAATAQHGLRGPLLPARLGSGDAGRGSSGNTECPGARGKDSLLRILRYAGVVHRAQTLAQKEGKEHAIALQLEYSLVERNIEREHIPVAQELGIGICPWSPIAGGFLAGKYKRDGAAWSGSGRFQTQTIGGPVFEKFTQRNWRILDVVVEVARQLGKTPAQVALNWAATQPGITWTIIGATKMAQFEDNLAALDFSIPTELRNPLDQVTALPWAHPYMFFGTFMQARVGGASVSPWGARACQLSQAIRRGEEQGERSRLIS